MRGVHCSKKKEKSLSLAKVDEFIPAIYSPAVTAEMLGLSLYRENTENTENYTPRHGAPHLRKEFSLKDMLPSPAIMKALNTFLPRAFALKNGSSLDESLVPKDSSIRHLFEKEENPTVHMTHHRINTPIGNVQISTITTKKL